MAKQEVADDDLDNFLSKASKPKPQVKHVEKTSRNKTKIIVSSKDIPSVKKAMLASKRHKDEDDDDDDDEVRIKHNFSPKDKKMFEKSGVPHSAFLRASASFDLVESAVRIEADLPRTTMRKISAANQVKAFEKLMENPLWGSYLYVISSYPSDLRAKQLALTLFSKAVKQYFGRKSTNSLLLKRMPPMWHNVMGGFRDRLLDNDHERPSLLVLSNVTEDSTQLKMEKLRDLIVKYDNIPTIVVTSAMDPVTFMLGKLKHPGDGFLYVGPEDKNVLV